MSVVRMKKIKLELFSSNVSESHYLWLRKLSIFNILILLYDHVGTITKIVGLINVTFINSDNFEYVCMGEKLHLFKMEICRVNTL